jgi:flagellar transcriptional activator FlhC
MRGKSVVADAREVARATELIELGMRLQMLESETPLSRERLTKLYKELKGKSPPKGMLPFSTDWFVTWMPNIHASLFMGIYHHLIKVSELDDIDALIKTYRLYLEQCRALELDVALSITRAWRLTRFIDAKMLRVAPCTCCRGEFVVREYDLTRDYVCGLCDVPSRAGKKRPLQEPLAAAA